MTNLVIQAVEQRFSSQRDLLGPTIGAAFGVSKFADS
jgi:hypothetical protein